MKPCWRDGAVLVHFGGEQARSTDVGKGDRRQYAIWVGGREMMQCGKQPKTALTNKDGGLDAEPMVRERAGRRAEQDLGQWQMVSANVLLVGAGGDLDGLDSLKDVRVLADVSLDMAAEHLQQVVRLDMVWLIARSDVDAGRYTELYAVLAERGCQLVCETNLDVIDSHMQRMPANLAVQWLVRPDAMDRRMALVAARPERQMAVHDASRDDAMARIDRLQEEVARISRLLGQLAGDGVGASGTNYGWSEGSLTGGGMIGGRSDQVRAAPRSFYPIGRTAGSDEMTRDRERAKWVRRKIRQRRAREQFFPSDLFADPAWDMLLDMFAARLERQTVSVSSLCIAAAVPATTALRWIKTLTDSGLFVREADSQDGRRIFIAMSDKAYAAMERYFEALEELG